MGLSLDSLFPQIQKGGLRNAGFLFGCGTSKSAGYPLMPELTKEVMASLDPGEKQVVDELLGRNKLTYDGNAGTPDIETIYDYILQILNSGTLAGIQALDSKIRQSIIEIFRERSKRHDLTLHIRFLKALRERAAMEGGPLWIFTTNYDLLFELAASEARISVVTGFDGPLRRFFDPASFSRVEATLTSTKTLRYHPRVILVKLHGSMSWVKCANEIRECVVCPGVSSNDCSMIMPRKLKVVETLESPYENLFAYTHGILGTQCKYLVSCGFGYRDQHIEDRLLKPRLPQVRLMALYGDEPANLLGLMRYPSFHFAGPMESRVNGTASDMTSDLWRFEKLVELLET